MSMVWAAKEAAFKLVSKEWKREHFVPREFVTGFDSCDRQDSKVEFDVFYGGVQARVAVAVSGHWAHAVATFPGGDVLGWRVQEIAACSEREVGAGAESEAARVLAAQLLWECGQDESLEFAGRIPVLRRRDGIASEMGISLSHHGAYAAVAIGGSLRNNWKSEGSRERLSEVILSGEPCSTCMA
jgi:phosphopantetheinyl transferase (holo-ACP synthase)